LGAEEQGRMMDSAEKRERLIEAAAALLSALDNKEMQITNLNKALFYLDLYALRDLGRPVTHAPFMALQQGPVVAKYKQRLIGEMTKAGLAEQGQVGDAMPVRLLKEPEFKFVTAEERAIAKEIAQDISRMTAAAVSRLSHKNPGWKLAYDSGMKATGKALAINLRIALQELAEADPWLKQPLTAQECGAVEGADRGEGENW
jgi:uncharacterized phage-associated protein